MSYLIISSRIKYNYNNHNVKIDLKIKINTNVIEYKTKTNILFQCLYPKQSIKYNLIIIF